MSGFGFLDYYLLAGDDGVSLGCRRDTTEECEDFGHTEGGASLRALVEAAQIHQQQHHTDAPAQPGAPAADRRRLAVVGEDGACILTSVLAYQTADGRTYHPDDITIVRATG